MGRDGWKDYDPETSKLLQQGMAQHIAKQRFYIGSEEYEVDFVSMKQYCVSDRTKTRRVQELSLVQQDMHTGLSNEFFWEAFNLAMAQAGYEVHACTSDIFDFRFNRDFRFVKYHGSNLNRGGVNYKIPVGWKRFAIKVFGKYDGGDNLWMHMDGKHGEWAVAYHGTQYNCLAQILHEGLKPGPRQAYKGKCGAGIYCTPNLPTAEGYASQVRVTVGGSARNVKFILQCRVRPSAIQKGTEAIWVINNTADISPYGVLVK